jgi:XRE family aerobic/anaerobic benzoate catabolism transcriptional regulator
MQYTAQRANGETRKDRLLARLGAVVKARRTAKGLTIRELAERGRVSPRFLVQLEGGSGNISVARMADVAVALGASLAQIFEEAEEPKTQSPILALLGLRGAGKSSLGPRIARRLKVPFVELDQLIAREAGMSVATIFDMHGEAYFRRVEQEALQRVLDSNEPCVLATGGSLVMHPESFDLLRARAVTVWLKARPKDHWERVVAQGDGRPMKDRPRAMAELVALLRERTPLYSKADCIVDTSSLTPEQAAKQIVMEYQGAES